MEDQLNHPIPRRRRYADTMLNPVPMKCEPSPLTPLNHRDQPTCDPVNQALLAICEHEINNLKKQWTLIGQLTQPPKRLHQNLHKYCINEDRRAWRNYDSAANHIRRLFRDIRLALKTLNEQRQRDDQLRAPDFELSYKAQVFLKRLGHDQHLKQSCHGARRFRQYQDVAEKNKRLHEVLHSPTIFDLGEGWEAERVVTRHQLIQAGKALSVCVAQQSEVSEQYFDALPSKCYQFWLIQFEGDLKCLLEIVEANRMEPDYDPEYPFLLEEEDGLEDVVNDMSYMAARNLVTSLKLDVKHSPELMRMGLFSAFLDRSKVKEKPDATLTFDKAKFELWFQDEQIIVYRDPWDEEEEPGSNILEVPEWELFEMETSHFDLESLRIAERGACVDPNPNYKVTRWTRQGCSNISEDTLLNVLAQNAINSLKG